MYKLLLLLAFSFQLTKAQEVQWASKLIKYSSDLGGKQFGIKRILGKPDAFPQGGYSANAWTPKNALDGREIVTVGFEKPQTVKQVAVFENLNAGCVTRILVSTDGEKFIPVWNRKPDYKTPMYRVDLYTDRSYYYGKKRRKIHDIPDVFNPGIEYAILENAINSVAAVRVEFNFALLPGQKQIDAIGISDSDAFIEPKINTTADFDNLKPSTSLQLNEKNTSLPCISKDGKNLFISYYLENEEEVIITYMKDEITEKWKEKKLESQLISKEGYNFVEFANEKFLLKGGVAYSNGSGECGFELFENESGNYKSLGQIKITAFNNYNNYSDATITDDLSVFIMAIETDFTQGGSDLYFTQRKPDGTYGFLQNMGKIINTAAEESNPQLLSDNKTLFFSSNGFSGYGDYDLFVSYRLDDTWKNWSEPINLGSKINSAFFDGSPFYDETSQTLYYNSSLENETVLKSVYIPMELIKNN